MLTAWDPLCFRESIDPDHTPDLALASRSLCTFFKISDYLPSLSKMQKGYAYPTFFIINSALGEIGTLK